MVLNQTGSHQPIPEFASGLVDDKQEREELAKLHRVHIPVRRYDASVSFAEPIAIEVKVTGDRQLRGHHLLRGTQDRTAEL
jgi:hypothetical protein